MSLTPGRCGRTRGSRIFLKSSTPPTRNYLVHCPSAFCACPFSVPESVLSIENKGFSTGVILRHGSTIRFGHERAARDAIPKRKGFLSHVEADQSASNPCPARRAGPPDYLYSQRPAHVIGRR